MKLIALFSPVRWSPQLLTYINEHKDTIDEVIGAYVVEKELVQHWARDWTAEGWIGEDTGRKLAETILDDNRRQAEKFFQRVEQAVGRPIRRVVIEGDFVDQVLKLADEEACDAVLLVRRVKPRWLRRWIKTDGERIARGVKCKVISIEPER